MKESIIVATLSSAIVLMLSPSTPIGLELMIFYADPSD